MRKTHTRFVGAVAALLAAGLAGFSLRSQQRSVSAVAARNPAPDVRTQVIRRTIHITRHEHAHHGMGPSGGRPLRPAGTFAFDELGGHQIERLARGGMGRHRGRRRGRRHDPDQRVALQLGRECQLGPFRGTNHDAHVALRVLVRTAVSSAPPSGPVTTRSSSHTSGGSTAGSGPVTTRSSGGHGGHGDGGDGGNNAGD